MATYSEAQLEKIDLEIRRMMVREPGISGRRIAVLLNYDAGFICRRKKKLERAMKISLEKSLVEDEIAKLENIYRSMALELYEIITSSSKDTDKVKAFEALFDKQNALIDRKMDAGIFTRKLGELDIKGKLSDEQSEIVNKALELMYANTNRGIKKEQGEQRLENTGGEK